MEDLVLYHSVWQSRILGAPDCAIIQGIKPEDYFMGRHRLVQTHEPSGRKNIYIAWHTHHIDERTAEESQCLIRELLEHASQDKYTFDLKWENVENLVIWVSSSCEIVFFMPKQIEADNGFLPFRTILV